MSQAYLGRIERREEIASTAMRLSRAEWRQVSGIAAQIDWARFSPGRYAALQSGLGDRTAAALHQLLPTF